MFKNLKLSTKIIAGFAVPLLMILGLATVISIVVNGVQGNATLAKDESVVFAGIARQMKLDAVQVQQWLTDISATRGLDGLDDDFDEAENSYQSFLVGLGKFKEMYQEENDTAGLQQVNELNAAIENYYEVGKKMAHAYIGGGPEAGNKTMSEFDGAAAAMASALDPFIQSQTDELDEAMVTIVSSTGMLRNTVIVASVAALVIGVVLWV